MTYYAGLDLGKMVDRTALAVVSEVTIYAPDKTKETFFRLGYLRQWPRRTPYTEIATDIKVMTEQYAEYKKMLLAVDATGIGTVFTEMLDKIGIAYRPVSITGGLEAHQEGMRSSVPKTELVTQLIVALESGRLKFHAGLPLLLPLKRQLKNFQAKLTDTGRQTFGAIRGHDDIVLALALALHSSKVNVLQLF